MTDTEDTAYNATCKAAWEIAKSVERDILAQIEAGEITDEEQISDALHNSVDNHLIYTRDQYICAWGLQDRSDAIEDHLVEPTNWQTVLAAQAFTNLRDECERFDFSDAIQVASDKREEEGA